MQRKQQLGECWGVIVRYVFYSYNTYIVIVYPIEAHYCYCCAPTLVLLYYWFRLVYFHCSCILWTPIYTKEFLSFVSSYLCEFMWCIKRLPPWNGLLSDLLSLLSHGVLILKFLCYFGIWFITWYPYTKRKLWNMDVPAFPQLKQYFMNIKQGNSPSRPHSLIEPSFFPNLSPLPASQAWFIDRILIR